MKRSSRPLLTRSTLTGRWYLNLRAAPMWLQYVLALVTVGVVVALAWRFGKDRPVPGWITTYLVPALGWIYLALVAIALGRWIYVKRRR